MAQRTASGSLKRHYDEHVSQMISVFKKMEPQYPRLTADMRAIMQNMYSVFAQTCHTLASRERRIASYEDQLQEYKTSELEFQQREQQRTQDLRRHISDLEEIELTFKEPVGKDSLDQLSYVLRNIHLQLLDNEQWQAKLHRIYQENMKLHERIDDLMMVREDLSNTVELLKTELTGRIQQVQFISKGLATPGNPVYENILTEMRMKAHALSQGRKRFLSDEEAHLEPKEPQTQTSSNPHPQPYQRTVILRRHDPSIGFGFMLQGGVSEAQNKKQQFFEVKIAEVFATSLAQESGKVFKGDTVTAVNGKSVYNMTHADIVDLIKSSAEELTLNLSSSVPVKTTLSSSNDQIQLLREHALEAIVSKNYDQGIKYWNGAIALNQNDPSLLLGRARALVEARRFSEAVSDCQAAIDLDATQSYGYYLLSFASLENGDLNKALEAANTAMKLDPSDVHKRLVTEINEQLEGMSRQDVSQQDHKLPTRNSTNMDIQIALESRQSIEDDADDSAETQVFA